MKRLFLLFVSIIICSVSYADKAPYRNGQRFTPYEFPLKGDVEQIEIIKFRTNPDNGEEYPKDTTIVKFNKNGDVTCIYPYVNTRYTDVVWPTELRFLYDDSGHNTFICEIVEMFDVYYTYATSYAYNADGQKVSGVEYNDDGSIIHTEEYIYDSLGRLTTEKYIRGNDLVIYSYDDDMNVISIEEYYEERLWIKKCRIYNQEGKLTQETEYHSNKLRGRMEIDEISTYFYDNNGFLHSSEFKFPIDEFLREYFKISRTEDTWVGTYKCDQYGNVIESISYDVDSPRQKYRTEYRISYR